MAEIRAIAARLYQELADLMLRGAAARVSAGCKPMIALDFLGDRAGESAGFGGWNDSFG